MTHSLLALTCTGAFTVIACSKGGRAIPTYNDTVKANVAKVATCKPFPENRTGLIKESYDCTGENVSLIINLSDHQRLRFIELRTLAPTAAAAKPIVETVFNGIVTPTIIADLVAHLDDNIEPAKEAPYRDIDGVVVASGAQNYGTLKKFRASVSWAW